jgi:hypothetical protein
MVDSRDEGRLTRMSLPKFVQLLVNKRQSVNTFLSSFLLTIAKSNRSIKIGEEDDV